MAGKRSARLPSGALGAVRMSAGQWVATAVTVLAIIASLGAYGWYASLWGNITTTQVDTDQWDRPDNVAGVKNILVLGSDVRAGENAEYGDAEGERPDTMLIASLNIDSGAATLVNLPRDLLVDLPACEPAEDYQGMDAHSGMFNSAMTFGGVACQWKAVEHVTGVHLDHFLMLDFSGFIDMVDALGGVEMCVPEPIDDPKAHLELEAGEQTLDGEDSLGYVRSRYAQGDGSDLSRIGRQQEFMGAMLREVLDSEVMTSPPTITNFVGAVTDSITTDEDLSVDTMSEIAMAMREVELDRVQFVTVPNGLHPANENRIILDEQPAADLFERINEGADMTGSDGSDETSGDGAEAPEPSDISIDVLNNTNIEGLASEVEVVLTGADYTVASTGNPQERLPEATTVYHTAGDEASAELLADYIGQARTEEVQSLDQTLELVIGADWQGIAGNGGASDPDSAISEELDGATAEEEGQDAC